MTTTRETASEAKATQYAAANTALQQRVERLKEGNDSLLEKWTQERQRREQAETVCKALMAHRRAHAAWERDDTVVTRQEERAKHRELEQALMAWTEFEGDE